MSEMAGEKGKRSVRRGTGEVGVDVGLEDVQFDVAPESDGEEDERGAKEGVRGRRTRLAKRVVRGWWRV